MLETPFIAECGERRAKTRKLSARLPKAVELRIDPGQNLVLRPFDPTSDAVQRRGAGNQRGDGAIVGDQL